MENLVAPKHVQSLWIGEQFSNVEKLCIQSFLDHGHEFHLYTYQDIKNIPAGTKIFDANEIMKEESIFRYKDGWAKGSVSGFADVFRLLLIKNRGGWWVDMDIICLKYLDLTSDLIFCTSNEGEYGSVVNNCIFKAPIDHFFMDYCLDKINQIDLQNMDFGLAGPFLFQQTIKDLKLQENALEYDFFNPINWKNVGELILEDRSNLSKYKELVRPIFKPQTMPGRRITENSYTLHLWNEVWKNYQYDKNKRYSESSIFEKLKKKHGIK
ncbi:glycosyltransferase [Pedobacter frigidisoli]|uniref:glycosyltransferase n=1 Tax=Pedobacter frigidisoli TaxID=2530455 RepID=UPI00292E6E05|nr:glycosyltransferase [Pedobacter frigidisoli]